MEQTNLVGQGDGAENKCNLIVNYLPQSLTDDEFKSLFVSVGPVKNARIIRERRTGYSYGFGFVEYEEEEHANKAIQTLNGMQIQNKRLKVAISRPAKGANVYIKGLPRTTSQEEVMKLMADFGTMIQCRVLMDQYTQQSKGVAFCLFEKREAAEAAILTWNGKTAPGGAEPLVVKFAEDNKKMQQQQFGGFPGGQQQMGFGYGQYGNGGGGGGGGGPMGRGGGPMRNPNRAFRYNPMTESNNISLCGGYGGMQASSNMGGMTGPAENATTLFVYNIGQEATDQTLFQLFTPFGTVAGANVMYDQSNGKCKGFGFIQMPNYNEALYAINNLNGYTFHGRPLQVSFKKDNK